MKARVSAILVPSLSFKWYQKTRFYLAWAGVLIHSVAVYVMIPSLISTRPHIVHIGTLLIWSVVTVLIVTLLTAGEVLPISLTVNHPASILSGGNLSPNTVVSFTCSAYDVQLLTWLRNSREIENFTSLDVPSTEPRLSGVFRVYLNSSDNDGQNNLNITSTLVGLTSDFRSGDQIACLESANGDTIVLNFTSEL